MLLDLVADIDDIEEKVVSRRLNGGRLETDPLFCDGLGEPTHRELCLTQH